MNVVTLNVALGWKWFDKSYKIVYKKIKWKHAAWAATVHKHLWFLLNTNFSAASCHPGRHTQHHHILQWKVKPNMRWWGQTVGLSEEPETQCGTQRALMEMSRRYRKRTGSVVCDWRWQPHIYLAGKVWRGILSPLATSRLAFFCFKFLTCESRFYFSQGTKVKEGQLNIRLAAGHRKATAVRTGNIQKLFVYFHYKQQLVIYVRFFFPLKVCASMASHIKLWSGGWFSLNQGE